MININLNKKLSDELWEYCKLNNIINIEEFTIKKLIEGFNLEKYGSSPGNQSEKIKEVEKIVEKIVDREVFVTDDESIKKLTNELNEFKIKFNDSIARNKELEEEIMKLKNRPKIDIYGDKL